MELHEFQAKKLFSEYGIPVPHGKDAAEPGEAVDIADSLKGPPWVIKAQVHAGGRGKGGGIKFANSIAEVNSFSNDLLNSRLVTKQTGKAGKKITRILVEEGLEIERELYISIIVDRSNAQPVMIFSQSGGMEIEEVAENTPELVLKEFIDPITGWMPHNARHLVFSLDPLPSASSIKALSAIMGRLYELFIFCDCSLVEINPLVITKKGDAVALDAKITLDDNALFRHRDLASMYDILEKDPLEAKAASYNLHYIRLDGNIGAMVNGAGLAMATMDVIKMAGAEPANFLDVGGGANEEMIARGFEIILSDAKVKAVLINIFGGILRCDVLARGVLAAAEKTDIQVPLIVRLEGTNVEEGRKILNDSSLEFLVAGDIEEAANLITKQV